MDTRQDDLDAEANDLLGDLPSSRKLDEAVGSAVIYPFHLCNIHERCVAAYVVRAVPFVIFAISLLVSIFGAFVYPNLLLAAASIFNVWMWLWLVSYATSTICATRAAKSAVSAAEAELEKSKPTPPLLPVSDGAAADSSGTSPDVVHLIVLPNYKEDESILASTLEALSQASGSSGFRVVLAMEEREGPQTQKKAARLQERYGRCFADLCAALHPLDLEELHLDGSANAEVPGKSSNLKWAVNVGRERCVRAGVSLGSTVLTVADADCIFHPGYFAQVGHEFRELRRSAANYGDQYPWTIWQAPQLPFRNYFASLAPARLWGYVATVYEFGGVGGLAHAGFHMTFSSFSLPLELVIEANPWDGDVIADDHHCYLKCFLYSVYQQASQQAKGRKSRVTPGGGVDPPLVVLPVMLPVKSTSVVADGCLSSWLARFEQAKRHSQGVAEFSYVLLGVFNLLRTLPKSTYSWALVRKVWRVVLLPFCINMLPICQTFPLAAISILWFLNGKQLPQCPNSLWLQFFDPMFYACASAGGWSLGVNMAIPVVLVVLANSYMLDACFVQPGARSVSVWHSEDGGLPATLGSKRLTVLMLVAMDCLLLLPAVMPIYGLIPAVMAYWNCLVRGNRFNFVSAAKIAASVSRRNGGSTNSPFSGGRRSGELPQFFGKADEDDAEVRQRQISKTPKSFASFSLEEGI